MADKRWNTKSWSKLSHEANAEKEPFKKGSKSMQAIRTMKKSGDGVELPYSVIHAFSADDRNIAKKKSDDMLSSAMKSHSSYTMDKSGYPVKNKKK